MSDSQEPIGKVELQSQVAGIISDCDRFVEEELSPARAKATDYYKAEKFGNEEAGRSQIVLSEVRDAVQGLMPPLLRVFFGPDRVVSFVPRRADSVEIAEQATDAVQYIFSEDNPGFLSTHSVLLDGLVRKLGVFKWGWVDGEPTAHKLEGIDAEQLQMLGAEESLSITSVTPSEDGATFAVELTRAVDGRARVWAVPPEEFIFNREARSLDEALCVAHKTEKTRGELLAMGVSGSDLDEHGHTDASRSDSEEVLARSVGESSGGDPEAGEANDRVTYVEAYMRLDADGDGKAELRRICTIGPGHYIVSNEPTDDVPFAIFVFSPEPHTIVGHSLADRVMDLQLLKSTLLRSSLDALAQSIFPRTAVVEGQVEIEDVLNNEIGAIIRQRAPGMVQPFNVPFAGKEIFPFLEYTDGVIERRTGQSKGTAGLDIDALQSTTKSAADAAVTGAQQQTEMVARIFAEMTLKPLFRGLLRLFVKNQPRERTMRLRGKWVPVNPSSWDADMDVTVNVALGSTLVEQRLVSLMGTAQKMEQIFGTFGLQNPLCTMAQYRQVLAKITELQGYKDVESFWQPVAPDWQPPPPPPAPPSPDAALVQIEAQKAQAQMQIKQQELQLKQAEMAQNAQMAQAKLQQEFTIAQEKMRQELELSVKEMELKYNAQIQIEQMKASIESAREDRRMELEHQRESQRVENERVVADKTAASGDAE